MRKKIVIIGAGASGINAAENIRKFDRDVEIDIIDVENAVPYYRTILSDYLFKEIKEEKFYLRPLEWYEKENINLHKGIGVKKLHLREKNIELLDGKKISYDKLILAMGARCHNPKVENNNLPGVFTMRSKNDTEIIKKYALNSKKALIVGGGVLGLEAACAMYELGLEVSIVEIMQRVLPRQLDEKGSQFLEERIASMGIKLYKNSIIQRYIGDKKIQGVELDRDRIIDTDLVIISAGIIPNRELIENSGIFCNRGILVNEKMETSVENVYACGDIAEYEGKIVGLWDTAVEQGKVAGMNAAGGEAVFQEKIQPLIFHGMNTKILSIGNVYLEENGCDALEDMDTCENSYKKFIFNSRKIVGGILLGDSSKGGELVKAVRSNMEKKELLKKIYG
ncbi:MAG: NAD(P)/FAD-dependent oxidoreductase [Fusobacteriaceae bacterium]